MEVLVPDIQLYRTRSRKRGVLVVFSYISFLLNIEPNRDGVNVDCDKLKYLFSEIGFEVLTYQNLTLEVSGGDEPVRAMLA